MRGATSSAPQRREDVHDFRLFLQFRQGSEVCLDAGPVQAAVLPSFCTIRSSAEQVLKKRPVSNSNGLAGATANASNGNPARAISIGTPCGEPTSSTRFLRANSAASGMRPRYPEERIGVMNSSSRPKPVSRVTSTSRVNRGSPTAGAQCLRSGRTAIAAG